MRMADIRHFQVMPYENLSFTSEMDFLKSSFPADNSQRVLHDEKMSSSEENCSDSQAHSCYGWLASITFNEIASFINCLVKLFDFERVRKRWPRQNDYSVVFIPVSAFPLLLPGFTCIRALQRFNWRLQISLKLELKQLESFHKESYYIMGGIISKSNQLHHFGRERA